MAQVVENLLRKYNVLTSNPSTTKKTPKKFAGWLNSKMEITGTEAVNLRADQCH
jgi:hypothetical protein